jgi:hypothetical protein
MAYKLVVADVVVVPMKFSLKDGGTSRRFDYTLQCRRITATEWHDGVRDDAGRLQDAKIKALMTELTIGWKGQTLVDDDTTGEPAEFCAEALEVMYQTPGVIDMAVENYLKEYAAKVKN